MPTWLLTPPADTNWHAFKAGGQKLGEAILKRSIPWLGFFNRGVVNSTLAIVDAPSDTLIDVYEPAKPGKSPEKIGYVSFKGNKPWLDFFNSQSAGGVPAVVLSIETASPLPDGDVAAPYSLVLIAEGGVQPYAWTLVSGSLPNGLTLSPDGLISGTVTGGGSFTFTAKVTDADGTEVSKVFTLEAIGATIFTDSFNRADTVNGYGSNWLRSAYGQFPTAASMMSEVRVISNTACMGASALGFTTTDVTFILPIPSLYPLQGISQFAEATFISQNNDPNRAIIAGIGVLLNWGALTALADGYVMDVQNDGGAFTGVKLRRANSSFTVLSVLTAVNATAADVFRIEATINPANTTVRCYINGALMASYVDTDAARPTFGAPGLVQTFITRNGAAGAASVTAFDSFSCGSV